MDKALSFLNKPKYCHDKASLLGDIGLFSQDTVRHARPKDLFRPYKATCPLPTSPLPRGSRLVDRLDPRRNNDAHGGDSTSTLHKKRRTPSNLNNALPDNHRNGLQHDQPSTHPSIAMRPSRGKGCYR